MDVVLLILFDVDILHLNVLKGRIPGFQWVFSLVFTRVTQYQHWENRNRFVRSSSEESTKEPEPSPRQVIVNSSVWQDDWHFRTTPWKEAFIAQVDEKLRKFSYKVSFIFIETDFHLRSLSDCRQPSPWPLLHKKKLYRCVLSLNFALI